MRASDLRELLRDVVGARRERMTAGRPVGRRQRRGAGAAAGHRRGARPHAGASHRHLRPRALAVRRALRPGRSRGPAPLRTLPALPGDELDPARSGGDLCIQACADDPQVAFHAVRNLARIGRGAVTVRWSQLGFGRTSSTSTRAGHAAQPHGLQGRHGEPQGRGPRRARAPRVGGRRPSDEPAWLRGGTYLVARRIRMLIEVWDRTSLGDQEQTIGRHKASARRWASATSSPRSKPVAACPPTATCAWPRPRRTAATRSCAAATRSPTGSTTASASSTPGCSSSPSSATRRPSSRVQRRLGADDKLNEYIKHVGSGVWVIPPGARRGGWVGETLLALSRR